MQDVGSNADRETQEALAIVCLAQGKTQTDTAAEVGVGRSTIQRWLKEPAFQSRVSDTRQELVSEVKSHLITSLRRAIDKLTTLLDSKSESIVLGSAKALLQQLSPISQEVDLEQRMAKFEAMNGHS